MKSTYKSLDCDKANKMDMVQWLQSLGHQPKKISGHDYWYLSPLREEKTPSFKVNRAKNVWFDHGLGKGGTLIDFGIFYHNCSVKELLEKLSGANTNLSFHPPSPFRKESDIKQNTRITILNESDITHPKLLDYLDKRNIPHETAKSYCRQVEFELNKRKHIAIGFKNAHGGFEFRNEYFKGSSSPKAPVLILAETSMRKELAVFEGFFSFLSYLTLQKDQKLNLPDLKADVLILNSAAFFERSRNLMEGYSCVNLFLDRDATGRNLTARALSWSPKYIDQSTLYQQYSDLNEMLSDRHETLLTKKRKSKGLRL